MIAFVRSETSERTDSASTPKVSSSMSQKTTSAPVAVIAWWQATYVYEGQMISSPGPAPASWQALCSAAVPLESASRWRSWSARRRYSLSSSSNWYVSRPIASQPPSSARCAAAYTSGPR
jgi:hypothetical protein